MERPPRSVSSGCHSSPVAVSGPPDAVEVAAIARARLDDAYRTHAPKLLRYFRGRVGDDAASDLMHEAFARTAESQKLHQLSQPAAYIWRVAKNLMFERSRKQRIHNAAQDRLHVLEESVSPPEQEWNIEANDLARLYEQAVETLPDKTRRVFLLRRIKEMSYREIADTLGISIKTVEYHMGMATLHIARVTEAGR